MNNLPADLKVPGHLISNPLISSLLISCCIFFSCATLPDVGNEGQKCAKNNSCRQGLVCGPDNICISESDILLDAGGNGKDAGNDQDAGQSAGRWAMKLTEQGKVAPQGLEPWDITINDLFIADIDATMKAALLTFCNQIIESQSTMGMSNTPKILIDALAIAPVSLALTGDGTFKPPVTTWLWGVKDLADPERDQLPTDASDAHTWDQDTDGNPGVTVDVQNPDGQRYMVRRSVWTFNQGTLSADSQTIEEGLTFTVEEHALGATNDILKTVAPIEPVVRGSKYQLRRVSAGFSCADLLEGDAWRGIFN